MAISNRISVQFNHTLIDEEYDFYLLSTSDKYIKTGSYILDKPIDLLKVESVVFDNGRSLFLMLKKGITNRFELISQIEDEKISLKSIHSYEIKDYILFRLFLYSLNNFNSDEMKFNNITGKLFITNPKWISNNRKTFKALNINITKDMCILEEATTFTQLSLFTNKRIVADYPKYEFSNKNCSLKRVLHPEDDSVYIKKNLFGNKAEIPFFDFSNNGKKNNKIYYLYRIIDLMKSKFEDLFSFDFLELNITKTICKARDEKIDETVRSIVSFKDINLINWSNSVEYQNEFCELANMFSYGRLGIVSIDNSIKQGNYNLVYLHNKEYYEQNNYEDPYKKFSPEEVIQHVTIEDSVEKIINNNESIYNTILKEFVIKDDLINNSRISIDNWESFHFNGNYIFGKEKDGKHYFIVVKPNGSFELFNKKNDLTVFNDNLLCKCSDCLTDNRGKEKTIVANPKGDIIVISRTDSFPIPSKEIFELEKVSRSKDERERLLSGVVDINLYNDNGNAFYSVGIKGSGMNTAIPKASHLYKIDVIEGQDFIEELLGTMAVYFVKYKSFTVMPYPVKYLNEYILLCEKNDK